MHTESIIPWPDARKMGGVDHIRAIPWKYTTLPDDALSGAAHSFGMPQRNTDAVVCPTRGLGSSTLTHNRPEESAAATVKRNRCSRPRLLVSQLGS